MASSEHANGGALNDEQRGGRAAVFGAPRDGWFTPHGVNVAAFDGPEHLAWWLDALKFEGGPQLAPEVERRVYFGDGSWLKAATQQLREWEACADVLPEAQPRKSLAERLRRLGWTAEGQLFRVSDAEGQPRPAAEVLLQLVEAAERRFATIQAPASFSMADVTPVFVAPSRTAGAVERTLKRLPEPASYETDGAAIAAVLRKVHGDEATEVAMAVLVALKAPANAKAVKS